MGVGLDDRPVHEGAGVSLVGVADQVLVLPFRLPGRVPLKPGGEACAAPTGQAGDLDLLDDRLRLHPQGLVQGLVALVVDVVVDAGGVHHAAVAQGHPLLLLQEAGILVADEHGLQLREVVLPHRLDDAQGIGFRHLHQAVEECVTLVDVHDGLQVAHADAAGGLHGKAVGGGFVPGDHLGHPGCPGGDAAAALAHQDTDALPRLPLTQFPKDLDGLLRGEVAIGFAIDHHHRRQGAAAQAGHLVEGEHAVLGGLPVGNAQLLADGRADPLRPIHVAGGAVAEHDLVGPHGFQPEIAIESGYPHHLGRAVSRPLGHMVDHFLGQVTIDRLCLLEDHDQAGVVILILAKHTLHQGQIDP